MNAQLCILVLEYVKKWVIIVQAFKLSTIGTGSLTFKVAAAVQTWNGQLQNLTLSPGFQILSHSTEKLICFAEVTLILKPI
jgi:hypothetical protein